jgi:hypothetical protein
LTDARRPDGHLTGARWLDGRLTGIENPARD